MMNHTAEISKQDYLIKTWHLFMFIVMGMWINTWIVQNRILTLDVYHHLLSDQLASDRIDEVFFYTQKLSIWNYISAPFLLWIRITIICLLLQFPLVFQFIEIPFKQLFRLLSFAEISTLALTFFKTSWLMGLPSYRIVKEAFTFTPLAVIQLLDASRYSKALLGLISHLNVFEMIWCLIIINGLRKTGKIKRWNAVLLVLSVWILIAVFQWALIAYLTKINS